MSGSRSPASQQERCDSRLPARKDSHNSLSSTRRGRHYSRSSSRRRSPSTTRRDRHVGRDSQSYSRARSWRRSLSNARARRHDSRGSDIERRSSAEIRRHDSQSAVESGRYDSRFRDQLRSVVFCNFFALVIKTDSLFLFSFYVSVP